MTEDPITKVRDAIRELTFAEMMDLSTSLTDVADGTRILGAGADRATVAQWLSDWAESYGEDGA